MQLFDTRRDLSYLEEMVRQHLSNLRSRTIERPTRRDTARWITENTTIAGLPYSFVDHEYQAVIACDESRERVIRKCSQVGISELFIRVALANSTIYDGYVLIYTFPSATFAQEYVKTRVDPVINGSPALIAAISANDVDSSSVKQIGNSFVHFKGAAVANAAISVAADGLIHDELDFSDQTVIDSYHSRLTHSRYKDKTRLSTPTVPGGPIDQAFMASRRMWNFCKCHRCGHRFIPNYWRDVVIPGTTIQLEELTKSKLHKYDHTRAVLCCPSCHLPADLGIKHREWVMENPTENHIAVGYQVQPFDCPALITIPQLIEAQVSYKRRADFNNFSLGLPDADSESGLTEEDLENASVEMVSSPFAWHVLGADMGLVCHIRVGGVADNGEIIVVHSERVGMHEFERRYAEISEEYRVVTKVVDMMPYTDMVLRLQGWDQSMFAAYFTHKAGMELFKAQVRESDQTHALQGLREVAVDKNKMLDDVMSKIRHGQLKFRKTSEWTVEVKQMTDMKRGVKIEKSTGETLSIWQKSNAKNDHYHMATLYMCIAAELRHLSGGMISASLMPPVGIVVTSEI